MYDKLGKFILKHKKLIIIAWIVALLVAVPFILQTGSVLKYDMTQMMPKNSDSAKGMNYISDNFESSPVNSSTIIVVQGPSYSTPEEFKAALAQFYIEFKEEMLKKYNAVVISPIGTTDPTLNKLISKDNSTMLFLVSYNSGSGVENVPGVRNLIKATSGLPSNTTTMLTGNDGMSYDTQAASMTDIERIDPFTIILILVLIGLFFRSIVASATPPLVIGLAFGVTMGLIFFVGTALGIFYITPIFLLVSMMGAGCDYCIFIMARYREERLSGKDKDEAILASVRWAGESITISGICVIIGFGALALCTFPMITTMGLVLAIGIIIALLAALTLVPSVLALVGDKIFYPTKEADYEDGSKIMKGWYGNWSRRGRKYFEKSSAFSKKYALPIVLVSILITVPLAYVAFSQPASYDTVSLMPDSESKRGIQEVTQDFGGGIIMPTYVVLEFKEPIAVLKDGKLQWAPWAVAFFAKEMSVLLPDLEKAISGAGGGQIIQVVGSETIPPEAYISTGMLGKHDASGGYYAVKLTVLMNDEPTSAASIAAIEKIKGATSSFVANEKFVGVTMTLGFVSGSVASTYEISSGVMGEFLWIEVLVVLLIIVLLFFVMKSYLTPIRAVVTILMSVVWTLGLTHVLFTYILGIPVMWMVPIILMVICLGLGMDYDILLTTRIRENVFHKKMSNSDAIAHAVSKSGAVITICGLIMGGAFCTLILSTTPMLQEFGFALGFAILVDALLVRTYIVPAAMNLMGDWNWKGPKFLQKNRE